jgi:4,5-dihydroxyphthalate decarboxylase
VSNLPLTFACGLYDRMLPIYRGDVRADGIDLNFIVMDGSAGAREIFDRMGGGLEFDLAEMSSSEFIAHHVRGNSPFVAIPVFPSRVFRHGMMVYNKRSGIKSPKDLAGKRVGLPLYSMSAATWARGHLQHDYGVDLSGITWVEGAVNAPGSHGNPSIPALYKDIAIEQNTSDRSLSDLLEANEIQAMIGTVMPKCFFTNPDIVRVFPDYREIEKNLYRTKKIFPIMHLVAMRKDTYERNPFIASSLFDAFCASKDRAWNRLRDLGTLQYMLPWMTADLDEIDEVFGRDPWPYGLEPNRPTLEAYMTYLVDQGIIPKAIDIDELFVPVYGRYNGKTGNAAQIK